MSNNTYSSSGNYHFRNTQICVRQALNDYMQENSVERKGLRF